MNKVIKKFEVETFEALGLVVVDVYPIPRCAVTEPVYRRTVGARTFQHLSDKGRATFISEAAAQGIQNLMGVKSEDD